MGITGTKPNAQSMEAIKELLNGFFMLLEMQRVQFLVSLDLVVLKR